MSRGKLSLQSSITHWDGWMDRWMDTQIYWKVSVWWFYMHKAKYSRYMSPTYSSTSLVWLSSLGCSSPGRAREAQGTWRGCGCHGAVFGHEIRHGPTPSRDEEGEPWPMAIHGQYNQCTADGCQGWFLVEIWKIHEVYFNIWLEQS